jgi:hypothetical protein
VFIATEIGSMKIPVSSKDPPLSDPEDISEARAIELTDLITHFAPKQPLAEFFTWLNEFKTIQLNYPENKLVQELLAKALKNSIRMFGERKNFADMLNILDDLDLIYNQSNSLDAICEYYAEALSIAIYYLRGSWDTEGTNKLLNRIRHLSKMHEENRMILLHFAKSYSNAINRFCSDRHNFICDKLLFELRMFVNKHRDDVDIQSEFAQALTNVIGTFARERRTNELNQVLNELKLLASRFPDSEKIQLLLTRATILSSLSENRNE